MTFAGRDAPWLATIFGSDPVLCDDGFTDGVGGLVGEGVTGVVEEAVGVVGFFSYLT